MDALLFAMNLEVMLLQLRILEGSVERSKQQYMPRCKKELHQREKLVRDRQIVRDVIRRTLIEVAEDGQWQTIQTAVEILELSLTSVTTLRASYEKLKTSLEDIYGDLMAMKHQRNLAISNCDQKFACLRDKIKDTLLNTNTQLSYAGRWLCARAESMELRFQFNCARATLPNPDHEYRVHNELLRAFELQIKERQELLDYWVLRYANDTEKLNERLTDQCEKLRVTVTRRQQLQELYDLHQGEMRGWLTFKKERAIRRAREERLRLAATRIQAWWRGIMVRRALGSFRYLKNAKKAPTKTKKK